MNDPNEITKRQNEFIQVFRELFPLAAEGSLPWDVCQVGLFLKQRIDHEIQQGTRHFTTSVVKVLCEVSPPKSHVADMARIVVDQAKDAERFAEQIKRLEEDLAKVKAELAALKAKTKEEIKR